jgi:hypothetical protein
LKSHPAGRGVACSSLFPKAAAEGLRLAVAPAGVEAGELRLAVAPAGVANQALHLATADTIVEKQALHLAGTKTIVEDHELSKSALFASSLGNRCYILYNSDVASRRVAYGRNPYTSRHDRR